MSLGRGREPEGSGAERDIDVVYASVAALLANAREGSEQGFGSEVRASDSIGGLLSVQS